VINSNIKQDIAAGKHPAGLMVFEFFTPGIARIAKAAGAEFILYDMEHSGADIETIKLQCATCRGVGVAPMVRVPTNQYHFVSRALDAGVHGVMVPMVETAEQAREIVSWSQYPPLGRRGAAFGVAHDDYAPGTPSEKMASAHSRTLIIAQIETPGGVTNVDEIAAVPGVDVVWLGHFDLTNFMGIPAQFDHPEYLAAVKRIVEAAKRHGKIAGFMAGDETWARRYYELGFRLFAYGLDTQLLQRELKKGLDCLRTLSE
jgi:2-keto-3-deoxy-L-rhamnonate aldolase RhmA